MEKIKLVFILFFLVNTAFSQNEKVDTIVYDPKAKELLDQLSQRTKSLQTIRVKFNYTLHNSQKKSDENHSGYMFLKGIKFKLILPGNDIFSDGKIVWNYIKDANEINITDADPEDESFLNPTKFFTLYEKGFKYKITGEEVIKGAKLVEVSLFPENPKKKNFTMVKLYIDKAKLQIVSVRYLSKEGNHVSVDIEEFKTDAKINDTLFAFDKAKYPANVEINDLREQ